VELELRRRLVSRGAGDGCILDADCVAQAWEALARSADCRMTERPIRRVKEPYAERESTAHPRLAEPSS
jgi:hypothetical protein